MPETRAVWTKNSKHPQCTSHIGDTETSQYENSYQCVLEEHERRVAHQDRRGVTWGETPYERREREEYERDVRAWYHGSDEMFVDTGE